ncbi:helix-turn-helix domain-containing protein [Enterococcus sp. LJL128]
MQMLSDQFMENMMNEVTSRVDRSLRQIEKEYAIRSKYLSKKNACIYATISPSTLEKWLAKGLPVSKIDRLYMINADDIDEFIAKHKL